ncbi:hypothetical protein [Endozoicomonas montiporae]|nr:hypothetical protein [Endozoicomonas montiporae]
MDKSSYPKVRYFRRHTSAAIQTIEALSLFIQKLATHSQFALVHGEPLDTFPQSEWVRRLCYADGDYPATLGNQKTGILIIDIDGLDVPYFDANREPEKAIVAALKALDKPFTHTSCHWQLTASQKPAGNRLYARLFFLLDTPLSLSDIKQWAKTQQKNSCIDPALYSPAQLIYVASPQFIGTQDWITKRNGLLKGDQDDLPSEILTKAITSHGHQRWPTYHQDVRTETRLLNSKRCVDDFIRSRRGQHWLSLIGDHEGGEGFYPIIRSLTASAARFCGMSLDKNRLKNIVRQHVWHSDSSGHSDDYLKEILTDRSLDCLIEGAVRKFSTF